jgi:anti-sigma factor ChrR (cupin superfamily)
MHAHNEIEQIYVLEGSFFDQDKTYTAGEYIVRAPGAMHTAGSDTGAVVLLFYSPAA